MLNLNSDNTSLGLTSNQLNNISSLQAATLGNQQALFPELNETLILQNKSSFNFFSGGEGEDILNGGMDKNCLLGAAGNDILIDSDGSDLMMGGEGADQFWINSWDTTQTSSTILDFDPSTDLIKIGGLDGTFDSLTFEQVEGETTVFQQENPLLTLIDVNQDSLTPDNFIFTDTAIANQPPTTESFGGLAGKDAADFSSLQTETPNSNIDIPNFNFPNIDQFFSGFISDMLSNTSLEDFLGFITGEAPPSESPSTSISSYPSSMEEQDTEKPFAQLTEQTAIEPGLEDNFYRIPKRIPGNLI
ncbi:MAG: hypothetical protein HC836_13350 [Richelia sp. RM2_1_2]|nr:hypothetical protein [Richelia sp. SM2_1_7]NJM19552.1 hypothetical protein [Richelia sp. SM1_7_0]NJN08729.1 hypothetical protein [Richelia sp. RM1_1_1]NJO27655.1 hypothetical protein [Richelia sp. SL_2_1]NJO59258.1 hypothetical protein [Richelia sp. RM2_1_2]NJS16283.1 hypothetical protein [Nostocaceae cyanobacterium CSU_2_110]